MRKIQIGIFIFLAFCLTFPSQIFAYDFGTTTLKLGSSGQGVMELQRFLNDNLNSNLVIDGKLGPKTVAIIKQCQKDNGLISDGLVGKKTKEKMNTPGTGLIPETYEEMLSIPSVEDAFPDINDIPCLNCN